MTLKPGLDLGTCLLLGSQGLRVQLVKLRSVFLGGLGPLQLESVDFESVQHSRSGDFSPT